MRATLSAPVQSRNHGSAHLVDASDAERWLNDILVATSRKSRRGARSQRVMQIEKDIGQGRCRPWRVIVAMLFSAQDTGVAIEDLEGVAHAIIGLLRTRAGVAPSEPLNQTIRKENAAECQLNPVQMALLDGECSPENLRAGVELTNRHIATLVAQRDKLNERLLACGPRMVAL